MLDVIRNRFRYGVRAERGPMSIDYVCKVPIKASPAECMAGVADPASWSDWARDVERVTALGPGAAEGSTRVEVVVAIMGYEHGATIDVAPDADGFGLRFVLAAAADLTAVDGGFRFTDDGSGTAMACEVHATLARPPTARIERMLGRRIETALSRDLVRHIERARRGR